MTSNEERDPQILHWKRGLRNAVTPRGPIYEQLPAITKKNLTFSHFKVLTSCQLIGVQDTLNSLDAIGSSLEEEKNIVIKQ